ncbi:MAG TPA: hypothetical protein ACFYEK_12035 [Candidatus Wunengus sp. YC60]|uniref:hypothetical protein n=1 Tax=Candidatus Wunengus sp. YC60 TaxID=3367697 RepID=UPI0040257A94
MKRPWIAIVWFTVWGLFQAYAVFSVLTGSWKRPKAFPEAAYYALIWPDMFFIPLYLSASVLLILRHRFGYVFGLIAGGAVIYVMIYLFALAGVKGLENVIFDGIFLVVDVIAVLQIAKKSTKN